MHLGLKFERIKWVLRRAAARLELQHARTLHARARCEAPLPCPPRYWLTAGAVPTPKVQGLLAHVGLIPKLPEPPLPPRSSPDGRTKWQTGLK